MTKTVWSAAGGLVIEIYLLFVIGNLEFNMSVKPKFNNMDIYFKGRSKFGL